MIAPRIMPCVPRSPLPFLLGLLCVSVASPAAAQAVRATVVDAATGAPVPETLVRVERQDGSLAGATFTRADGVAVVRLRDGGSYRVVAERGGYDRAAQPLDVGPGGRVDVTIRVTQRPFSMDTVEVIARGRDERGRDAFERHRAMHEGVFLDSAYLAQRTANRLTDFLVDVPGISMWAGRNGRQPRTTRGWGCMVTLMDGLPVTRVVRPRDIKAVEVYREPSEVPPEYRIHARQGIYPCGVSLYWTHYRW
ncbi:carboxypeptidase-like regulatory domain-containing protein [Longimicrobium sp.]|uniref:carboxypeptidase-like regulatory domain-containing protein n=1 Tax=Longimicrobium sp. TaxID=2029185 RepID=UPI002E349BB4|nr:carboxypeptidase regulatory-like domain-containing protein [Longimicrobium sp.]HEX6042074.1 carboxypeptidase regulatory-like domain-containing protein [Longimicrobium sp.]